MALLPFAASLGQVASCPYDVAWDLAWVFVACQVGNHHRKAHHQMDYSSVLAGMIQEDENENNHLGGRSGKRMN